MALKENIRGEGKRDIQTKVMTTPRAGSSSRKLGRPKGSLARLSGSTARRTRSSTFNDWEWADRLS